MADDTNGGIITNINGWLTHPFNTGGSAFDWFLFLGLVIIAVFFWTRVLAHIEEI